MRTLPSAEKSRIRFVRIKRKRVVTAPGVKGGETVFETVNLSREVRWGERNIKL